MKRYNLIFLRSDPLLLSGKQYTDWRQIQDEYEDYLVSLDFDTLEDVKEYLMMEYKLTEDKARLEVNKLNVSSRVTVEIAVD